MKSAILTLVYKICTTKWHFRFSFSHWTKL